MRKITVIIALFLAAIQIVSAQKVGLVLSGGGAKGAAHIGVIKALEENNIPIDYITGTSIGAIIGSLYAMGYSPEEMLELMLSKEFAYWQTGTVEEQYTYYFKEPYPTPEFAHFSIDMSDSLQIKASFLPQSLINPIQMNQAFMALFSQATAKAGWNFDNLFVPFRCVASDIYTKKPIIFKNGDLGDAVRASMTFPFFFQPIWKDSIPLFDGGIYDNFPVGPMKDAFHPDFIFGSTVSGGNKKPSENPYNQIETMIMQKTDYEVPEEDGMMIKFSFPTVSLLDFQKGKELMDIGYKRTLSMIDSSIGGKTAVDLGDTKNIVGAFWQPKLVIVDPDTLSTLPRRHYINGLAEAVKASLLADPELFAIFEKGDIDAQIGEIICRSLRFKKGIVEQDETEQGMRKALNFGHTIGHGIEAVKGIKGRRTVGLYHGECVALGMLPMIESKALQKRVRAVYRRLGLPTRTTYDKEKVLAEMLHDKKAQSGQITIIKVPGLGCWRAETIPVEGLRPLLGIEE